MENIDTYTGGTRPVLHKKNWSIEDYKKKISPENLLRMEQEDKEGEAEKAQQNGR